MYYYTSNSSYRKSKTTIDFMILMMTVIIVALFACIIFWASMRNVLFPSIFVAGGIINLLHAIKNFINSKKKAGIVLIIFSILLLILAAYCWNVASRTL